MIIYDITCTVNIFVDDSLLMIDYLDQIAGDLYIYNIYRSTET